MNGERYTNVEAGQATTGPFPPLSRREKAGMLINVGLLLSIAASIVSMLPLPLPFFDGLHVRLASGVAVIVFLELSFWFAGWVGSALSIPLLGVALAFSAFTTRELGLVAVTLTALMGITAVLLLLCDVAALQDNEWVQGGKTTVVLGVLANVVAAAVSVVLWLHFAAASSGLF